MRGIDGFPFVDRSRSIVPPDVERAVGSVAVSTLREDAAHEFEADGFDMDTCEDAAHVVESSGFRESMWLTSPDVVDDARDWYDERTTVETPDTGLDAEPMVAHRPVLQAPEGVVAPGEMFLIGEGAVTTPPFPVPGVSIVVRNPEGVAVVHL